MGAGTSICVAAAYPELIEKLVLIENFGLLSKKPDTAVASMRSAVDSERRKYAQGKAQGKLLCFVTLYFTLIDTHRNSITLPVVSVCTSGGTDTK